MFPLLGVVLSGLQPDQLYDVKLDIVPVNRFRHRYIYQRSRWTITGGGLDDVQQTACYQHPSSLTRLCEATVTFDRLKLTNTPDCCSKHVRLSFLVHAICILFLLSFSRRQQSCQRLYLLPLNLFF